MEEENYTVKIDALWETLKRIDFYMGSTNFKSALLVTLNSAIFGTILLNHHKMVEYVAIDANVIFVKLLLMISAVASIVSIIFVLLSIFPNLDSENRRKSLIFFGDICSYDGSNNFSSKVRERSNDDLYDDLAGQVWILSRIILLKFNYLRNSIRTLIFGSLVPLIFLGMVVLA